MGANSNIEWTDHTFNPWRGCTKVHEGCAHCYAERDAKRFPDNRGIWAVEGDGIEFCGELCWDEMLGIVAKAMCMPSYTIGRDARSNPPADEVERISIEGGDSFFITIGPRFTGELTYNEMLAWIAAYTLNGSIIFSGLKTYEEWLQSPYGRLVAKPVEGYIEVSA